MLKAIIFRYLGTVVQFILLAGLAKALEPKEYGIYILCLSVTFSYYYIVGLGASESALVKISELRVQPNAPQLGEIIGSVLLIVGFCTFALLCASAFVLVFNPLPGNNSIAVAFVCLFLAANGIVFNVAQILIAMGKTNLGSFFFYPAINLSLLLSFLLLLLLGDRVTFNSIAAFASLGSSLIAAFALTVCWGASKGVRLSFTWGAMVGLVRGGAGITALRILHVASFWVPTVVVGLVQSSEAAGQIGTAGRLSIAVSSVIAAIRFVIRPKIAGLLFEHNLSELAAIARSLAFLTTTLSLLILGLHLVWGKIVIGQFFGANMISITPIVSVLLVSVCAEAVFGPVDEILKINGNQRAVAWTYFCGVLTFTFGVYFVSNFDLAWVALLQVVYVFGIFGIMNIIVRQQLGFWIYPSWSSLAILKKV
jgi:O-antigen/teichoic acid export membrane protein